MRLSNSKLLSIAITVFGIIWILGIYVISDMHEPTLSCAGGVVFGVVAVVASVLYLAFFRTSPGRQAVESGAFSAFASVAYVVSTLSTNTVFVLTQRGHFSKLLILVNLCISTVYFIIILFAEKDVQRLSQQLNRMERSTETHINISEKLGILLSMAPNGEIRNQILKLKECVDYSSNTSTGNTCEFEQEMDSRLSEIIDMLSTRTEETAIREQLHSAEMTWNARSVKASSRK